MKKFYIVGAGALGREIHAWLNDWCDANPGWKIAGYLNDIASTLDTYLGMPPIVSTIDEYVYSESDYLVCAIADPSGKKDVIGRLKSKGARFFTLIHPSVVLGQRITIGEGVVICPLAVVSSDIVIGDFVMINSACTVAHDARIGRYSTLSGHCDITGGVTVEDEVFMGSHAVVLPNVRVGHGACVGAGSVVVRRVSPGVTVFGVPAKQISRKN